MDARVLAVDDDNGVRQLLVRLGQRLGLRVELASDGREALTKFQAHPRVFMSGYTSQDVLRRTGNAPGVRMLDKPFRWRRSRG